jgi:hypothetical protein
MRSRRAPLRTRPWQGRPVGTALPVAAAGVVGLLHYAAATPLAASLACTPSPRLRARLVRFAPAVRPAPGVLRVLRRRNPFVGLAPRRRSRVPTQVATGHEVPGHRRRRAGPARRPHGPGRAAGQEGVGRRLPRRGHVRQGPRRVGPAYAGALAQEGRGRPGGHGIPVHAARAAPARAQRLHHVVRSACPGP